MKNVLRAVIFDLDGVITDSAEYHFRAWQQLAQEEGITFTRSDNEQLRGVARRESLLHILQLGNRTVDEATLQTMMARKNDAYIVMLQNVTASDMLPGVATLLDELDAANIPYALGSASRNARLVLEKLGIIGRFAFIADGNTPVRKKPAPDLFRYAATQLNVPAHNCLVVEDAAAGVRAAQAAGMATLAVGDADRFGSLLENGRTARHDNMSNVRLATLQQIATLDPLWHVTENSFEPAKQHHKETVFTLGNGYFSSRGTFEEGYPQESRITFAHGIWNDMPVSFTELVNLPNWMDLDITVDGMRFRLDEGTILDYQRHLDVRRGLLLRDVRWQAPSGVVLDMRFERFIAYTNEHVGAMRVLITAVNQPTTVQIASGINGHVANLDLLHLNLGQQGRVGNDLVWLQATTRHTRKDIAAAARVISSATSSHCEACPGHPRLLLDQQLAIGQTCQLDKLTAYTFDRDNTPNAADVVDRAQAVLINLDYDQLRHDHVNAWQALWQNADVIIEGDTEAQLSIRFNLFQLLVAAPQKDERVSIGAKTLSGFGYRGHVFWDCEIFILPFFIYNQPRIARNMLMYRYHTLAGAREKATGNGFLGAQYAWESAETGEEVTPTWVPHATDRTQLVRIWTGDIEIHISADIAYAIKQYCEVTGDEAFMRDYGAEIILDTACFWGSRAEYETTDDDYHYAIRDVIGPDEYHDHVDNNTFTNRMCQWHLEYAFDILDWLQINHPDKYRQLITDLQITDDLKNHWRDVIDNIIIHFDPDTKLMTQFDGFFERKYVDLAEYEGRTDSMQAILGIEGANETQILKQADVVMLMCLLRDEYDQETWRINYDTYMPRTDHSYGSSLSPSFHAWAAAEMNDPASAYEHYMLAARADLLDVRGNANDGIHAASAGGLWQAIAFGFAGLRLTDDGYTLAPRLPSHWQRIAFSFYHKGQRHEVDIRV